MNKILTFFIIFILSFPVYAKVSSKDINFPGKFYTKEIQSCSILPPYYLSSKRIEDKIRSLIGYDWPNDWKKNSNSMNVIHGGITEPMNFFYVATYNALINKDEIDKIQKEVNLMISNSCETLIETKTQEEATQQGAMALFGEKYGDLVRVVTLGSFQNNPYSIELCGGTHVSNTNLIKKFLIISEESVSSGVRRIEACTADKVDEYLNNQQKELENYEKKLDQKINSLINEIEVFGGVAINCLENKSMYIKKLESQLAHLKNNSILKSSNVIEKKEIKGVNFITQIIDGLPPKELRSIFDSFKKENSNSILACITTTEDKVSIIVGVTADLKEIYDARELIKASFDLLGSKGGGGRPDFAQAGGTEKNQINQAFLAIQDKI